MCQCARALAGILLLLGLSCPGASGAGADTSEATAPLDLVLRLLAGQEPTLLCDLGEHFADIATATEIVFAPESGDLTDPVLYDRVTDNFHFDGLYRATAGGQSHYFRFGWQHFDGQRTHFLRVRWADDRVPPAPGPVRFEAVRQEISQTGATSVATVGDSIIWWGEGETLRARLRRQLSGVALVGTRTDTLGYGHEGEGGDGTVRLLQRLESIAVAQHYVLLIGGNDRPPLTPEDTVTNIQAIAAGLLAKTPDAEVHVLTLLPRGDDWDARNRTVNARLREWIAVAGEPRLHLADTEQVFRDIPNWPDLFPDRIHANAAGYEVLASCLAHHLAAWLPAP